MIFSYICKILGEGKGKTDLENGIGTFCIAYTRVYMVGTQTVAES